MQEQHQGASADQPGSHTRQMSVGSALFLAGVLLIVGFVAGTRSDEIIARVGPLVGMRTSTDTLDLDVTQEVYQRLKANYDGELDTAALIDGAARGMVAAAGDQHTIFYDAEEADEGNDDKDDNDARMSILIERSIDRKPF